MFDWFDRMYPITALIAVVLPGEVMDTSDLLLGELPKVEYLGTVMEDDSG